MAFLELTMVSRTKHTDESMPQLSTERNRYCNLYRNLCRRKPLPQRRYEIINWSMKRQARRMVEKG